MGAGMIFGAGVLLVGFATLLPVPLVLWTAGFGTCLGAVVRIGGAHGERERLLGGVSALGVAVALLAVAGLTASGGGNAHVVAAVVMTQIVLFGLLTLGLSVASSNERLSSSSQGIGKPDA